MPSMLERKEHSTSMAAGHSMRRLWLMAICVTTVLVSVELFTGILHNRRRVTLDIERGVHNAIAIQHDDSHRQILVAGNSLVFADLSQKELQETMGTDYIVHAAGAPGSTYYDWAYGFTSLFARGSRPDIVVFGISPSQFLRTPATTPLPVSQLWRTGEILAYWREQHLSLTNLSELMLEHYSTFYYMRDTVRIYLRSFIPGYASMVASWRVSSSQVPGSEGEAARTVMVERLSGLAKNVGPRAQLVLMIAPTRQEADKAVEPALRLAAGELGIPVVEPVGEQEWPISNYSDGYHLNAAAAEKFSRLVGADLVRAIKPPQSHP